jgi:hypothetical protein
MPVLWQGRARARRDLPSMTARFAVAGTQVPVPPFGPTPARAKMRRFAAALLPRRMENP